MARGKCNKCGQPINWKHTSKGWRPFNINNSKPHFTTCIKGENYQLSLEEEEKLEEDLK